MKKIAENIEQFKEIDKKLKKIKDDNFVEKFDEAIINNENILICTKNNYEKEIFLPNTIKIDKIQINSEYLLIYASIKDLAYIFKIKNIQDKETLIVEEEPNINEHIDITENTTDIN